MMPVLRKAEESDAKELRRLETASFGDPWSEKMIADLFHNEWDHVYVLEREDHTLSGYINYRFLCGEGELMRIAVDPCDRGRGYSRKLMDQMEETALKNEITAETLEVRSGNVPAIKLYESYGFVKEAVRKDYYEDPVEDALIMWLRRIS